MAVWQQRAPIVGRAPPPPSLPLRTREGACRQRPFAAETHAMGGPERALRWAATLQLRAAVLFWFSSRNHFLILKSFNISVWQ